MTALQALLTVAGVAHSVLTLVLWVAWERARNRALQAEADFRAAGHYLQSVRESHARQLAAERESYDNQRRQARRDRSRGW